MNVLTEADEVTSGPRRRDYDHPRQNFDRIAKIWSVLTGVEITPRQTALMMIGLKLTRDMYSPKRDNLVDIAGYARCIELLEPEPTTWTQTLKDAVKDWPEMGTFWPEEISDEEWGEWADELPEMGVIWLDDNMYKTRQLSDEEWDSLMEWAEQQDGVRE